MLFTSLEKFELRHSPLLNFCLIYVWLSKNDSSIKFIVKLHVVYKIKLELLYLNLFKTLINFRI